MRGTPKARYRPSNGTEGMAFEESWCGSCWKASWCRIPGRAMLYDIDEPRYPHQWCYDDNGLPQCTAYAETRPKPRPRIDARQLSLIP